jgi:hypothetical protein
MSFSVDETVILTDKAANGLPMRVGSLGKVIEILHTSPNYDYDLQFTDGVIVPVRECELKKLSDIHKKYLEYIYEGNKVGISDTVVKVIKADYFNGVAEIEFDDQSGGVEYFERLYPLKMPTIEPLHFDSAEDEKLGKFGELGLDIGKFTDDKNKQYGSSVDATYEMMKVLMNRYTYDENNYLIPKELVRHMLLQVRIMDKQNRIFNNPTGKDEKESPYKDITGYGLIGVDMVEHD